MHCHDYNSDKPDEILGRILNVSETWLESETLLQSLKKHGCNAFTITNHNNARSCWEMQDKGFDVLSAAEFSCHVPDFNVGIHVLAYGFTPREEQVLLKLRRNIYHFQEYALQQNIPTVWAHPLYFYAPKGLPSIDFFNKMLLVFERFEVLNGQRDTWQNMLSLEWLKTFDEEKMIHYAKKYDVQPHDYCFKPLEKSYTGGSDSHMGIFAGLTGTQLYIPNLAVRKLDESMSSLALEAIINGDMIPFGANNSSEKMAIAFLDYVCQIAIHHKDPGLFRILLHKGTMADKSIALLVTNAFGEIRRHKVTMNFIELFHKSFLGKVPSKTKKWFIPSVYKPVFDDAKKIADTFNHRPTDMVKDYDEAISSISNQLNLVLAQRFGLKMQEMLKDGQLQKLKLSTIIEKLELPSELRVYLDENIKSKNKRIHKPDIGKFLDGLNFPFLASSLILSAHFTSAKVLYSNRPLLNSISEITGKYKHPKRMLWMTDTFNDQNGVSMVLKSVLQVIKERNLPIDILIASYKIKPEEHLKVIKPISEFDIPNYSSQSIRIPNFLEIHRLFQDGDYDRLMCSTEGPMGLAALYLKHAFSVKSFFYLHTDWMMFAKKVLKFDRPASSRLRRILRTYYSNFDGLFVLNKDQKKWLSNKQMNLKSKHLHLTAHWVDEAFKPQKVKKEEVFGIASDVPVLLYAGRVSREKGVDELVEIFTQAKKDIPKLRLLVIGTGPFEEEMKEKLPDELFFGWVERHELPRYYSAADLLVLPSKFDTFSMVVLESISCGLPVVAYDSKGPKDILSGTEAGFLVKRKLEMSGQIASYFQDESLRSKMIKAAVLRSQDYSSKLIMDDLLKVVEL
ncbi:glycosyltransferase [Lentimicrobium sp. L6]|uniref:glycosyltransferase n=1 Tax=Lentimicrobium sp. L6 TaxID=2735916 RepID=UPI001553B51F|nr:glycosyltransferase [Lentimicrobium sp. L6]NPD84507.1 glycosyltransferase [Lentimicrobium sp. L6]